MGFTLVKAIYNKIVEYVSELRVNFLMVNFFVFFQIFNVESLVDVLELVIRVTSELLGHVVRNIEFTLLFLFYPILSRNFRLFLKRSVGVVTLFWSLLLLRQILSWRVDFAKNVERFTNFFFYFVGIF